MNIFFPQLILETMKRGKDGLEKKMVRDGDGPTAPILVLLNVPITKISQYKIQDMR
jgi:hypothetical protein